MIKKKIILLSLLFLCVGCAKTVSYNISEKFIRNRPGSIILMPVIMMSGPKERETEILKLVRSTVQDKLKDKKYSTVPIDKIDSALTARGLLKSEKLPAPQLVVSIFKSDAVLYSRIIEWNEDKVASYAALKITAEFLLYSINGDL
ncbi:MAG: hypothetical protein V3V95_06570, partial [Thermodesulfobacteriota bacterium]